MDDGEGNFDATRTDLRDPAVLVTSFDLDHDARAAAPGLAGAPVDYDVMYCSLVYSERARTNFRAGLLSRDGIPGMSSLERPKLRPVNARKVEQQGQSFVMLQDVTGAIAQPVLIPVDGFNHIVRQFEGQSTLIEIQGRVLRSTGLFLALNELASLVRRLAAALIFAGPTFDAFHRSFRESGRRPAAMAGRSYAATARALQAQLEQFFVDSTGAGIPAAQSNGAAPALRGVLSPHIDFQRGGAVYTWAYRELIEKSNADTFVILGVAHQYCRRRFALTFKDFETPLGVVPTDRAYVDRIASLAGRDLFDDELCHRTEHSIEFQVVFLQYVLGGRRDFSIVPILVGWLVSST